MKTQNKEPNIRFSQFKGLWKVVKLDSISQKVKSKNINNTFENVLTNSAEFGIIPQRDFFDKDIANLKSLSGYYVVQPNDFVYNPRISNKAPVGPIKANFLNSTGVMSPLYYVFRTRDIDVFFLAKYFDSSYWHKFMKLNGDTGARSDRFAIKDSVFKEMPIPFPSYSEQSVIGSLFRTLDDLLASYKDNLANYQSLKATMFSKMFPKAGQTVPEIHLDRFEGEWEEKCIGEIADIVRGASPRPIQDPKWFDSNSEIGWLRISDVTSQNGRIHSLEQKISKLGQEKTRVLTEPHLLLSIAATVGKPVVNYVKTGVHDGFLIFMNPKFDREFMFQWLEMFREKWNRYGQPGSQVNLNSDIVKNQKILIPSMEEQQAIGTYFSNLDNLISAHQEKISQLETLKKKLLQDMFI